MAGLDNPDMKPAFDPRKTAHVVSEFQHLLSHEQFKKICNSFKRKMNSLIKQSLSQQDVNNHTPLHIASYFGDFKISKYFVDKGAERSCDTGTKKPLEVSKNKQNRDVLQSLNQAAFESKPKDLQYLVNCGEDIDCRMSITGAAPVHRAVQSKANANAKSTVLDKIIECNAEPDTLDSNGWTALIHACYNGDEQSAKRLLEAGASVREFSNSGKQALHFAASKGFVPCIQLLLNSRASIEAVDNLHCTALHYACKYGHIKAIDILLDRGANIYACDERDWTPLHYAAYNGHSKVCKQLLSFSADDDPKLRDARNS